MNVLTISDEVSPAVYSLNITKRFGTVQLVLSCGDLPFSYLDFIVTMLGVPCAYVRGNHDGPEYTCGGHTIDEAQGCTSVEDRCILQQGLLIAGLGGSIRYNNRNHDQYTEFEMAMRAWRLVPRLLFNRYRYGRYLDILLTHAPPWGIHDGPDFPHRGFHTFRYLMERFAPRYLIHGHIHLSYNWHAATETQFHQTQVINTAGYRLLTIHVPAYDTGSRLEVPATGD